MALSLKKDVHNVKNDQKSKIPAYNLVCLYISKKIYRCNKILAAGHFEKISKNSPEMKVMTLIFAIF